jgi:hypothetical protein
MTDAELKNDLAVRTALHATFLQYGMRPQENSTPAILAMLKQLGCTLDMSSGYLRIYQAGTEIAPSGAAERIRKELPQLFAADPKRDAISSLEDLERGTREEISKAKSLYIKEHGMNAFTALPKTRKQAAHQTAPTTADMTKAEWLALPVSERARLSTVFDPATLSKIIARRG